MEEQASPLALVDLLCALVAGALWYVRPELGPWPLLLILVGLVVRHLVEPRPVFELTGIDAAVALFTVSALLGLLNAYHWNAALYKFWVIVGGVAIYGSLVRAPAEVRIGRRIVAPVRLLLAVVPSLIAAYYLVTADYTRIMGKLPLLDGLFGWIASVQPSLPGHKLHPNVAGGLIAALLPLQFMALWGRRERYLLLGISTAGLLLTVSRGAWLALAVVAVAWFVIAALRSGRRVVAAAAAAAAVALIIFAVVFVPTIIAQTSDGVGQTLAAPPAPAPETSAAGAGVPLLPDKADASAAVLNRGSLLGNSLGLAWDYAFTGLGLSGFQMAYSSYMLLIHVGHTVHSHNLFVDVWLELGLPGLLALTWLLAAAVVAVRRVWRWGDDQGRGWASAALGSLVVLSLHGLVDDAFFGSRGILLMFVPFAVLAREQSYAIWRAEEEPPTLAEMMTGRGGLILACAAVAMLLTGLLPPVRSQLQANLGALSQTRAELAVYEWPAWPVQDELRRSPAVDLNPALAHYEKALALDGWNATANRRLGQIAFSRGDDAHAGELLAAAYRSGYTNRATRQLYGEWLAINGRPQEAAVLWRSIDMSQGQLQNRIWWFEHAGKPEFSAALRLAESMR